MSKIIYRSVFSEYFNSYCELHVGLGYSDVEIRHYFKVFDDYFVLKGINSTFVTESVYNEMMDYLVNENGRNRYRYASKFTIFHIFLHTRRSIEFSQQQTRCDCPRLIVVVCL